MSIENNRMVLTVLKLKMFKNKYNSARKNSLVFLNFMYELNLIYFVQIGCLEVFNARYKNLELLS